MFTHAGGRQGYSLNAADSTDHYYDRRQGQYVFNVELGGRFYLKLNILTSPSPAKADLIKNGKIVKSTKNGTIYVDIDRMGIQTVDRRAYAGNYTIRSYTDYGALYGEFSFQLVVNGMYMHPIYFPLMCM